MIRRIPTFTAILLLVWGGVSWGGPAETPSAAPLTLSEAYALALRQSETLRMQEENLAQLESRYKQAWAAVLPDVRWVYTDLFQDTSGSSGSDGNVGGTFTARERPQASFRAQQPLFSGFREFAALSATKNDRKKEEQLYRRAQGLLYQDVARAFYLALQYERELFNIGEQMRLTQDRVGELNQRVRLGKSRRSETLSSESQMATLQAEQERLNGLRAVAREMLSFYIGQPVEDRALDTQLSEKLPIPSEETLLAKADQRSDLQAARLAVESQKFMSRYYRGAFFPKADLEGNYYTKRTGFQKEIDWDVLFTLEVPLFQGGSAVNKYRESKSLIRWAEWSYARLRRDVQTEVKSNVRTLQSALAQTQALRRAYDKAQQSYRLQRNEYRMGLVNNLEVLQAMNSMTSVHRSFDQALVEAHVAWVALKVSIEDYP